VPISERLAVTHLRFLARYKAGDQRHELVLVKPIEGAVEHHLGGQQLICGVNLTGCPPLQCHNALFINHAKLAQNLGPITKTKCVEGKGREGKGREGKGREGKGREGKGREGKGTEGKGMPCGICLRKAQS